MVLGGGGLFLMREVPLQVLLRNDRQREAKTLKRAVVFLFGGGDETSYERVSSLQLLDPKIQSWIVAAGRAHVPYAHLIPHFETA